MAKALAQKLVRQRSDAMKEEADLLSKAVSTSDNTKKDRYQELQQEEIINVVPQLFPQYYSLNFMGMDEINRKAVCNVANPAAAQPGCANLETVDDPRMGPTQPGVRCVTCSKTRENCVGHYGKILFPIPILNPHPEGVRAAVRVLNVICCSCGKPKCTQEELDAKGISRTRGEQRLLRIEKLCRGRTCKCSNNPENPANVLPCENRIFSIKTRGDKDAVEDIVYQTSKGGIQITAKPSELYEIFDSISDEDAKMLGFEHGSHPRNLIMWGMLVIPPGTRPATLTEKMVVENHLTRKYRDILKSIAHINYLSASQHTDTIEYGESVRRLRTEIKVLIGIVEQKGGRMKATRSIKKLISGKQGLIIHSIQSKRTENTGRAVLSIDPGLRYGQIGIPRMIARKLTVRESVNAENVDSMTALLKEGEIIRIHKKVPGRAALLGLDVDDQVVKRIVLQPGDEVERATRDGDIIMFWRNPTLTKQSMMAAEAKITDDRLSIDLHISYLAPLAGDLDGDELNLAGPLVPEAREEARRLLHVKKHIISSQSNRPLQSLVFDTITGVHLMTREDSFLDHNDFQRIIGLIEPPVDLDNFYRRLRRHFVPIDSGRALFSAVLPEGFYYHIANPHLSIQDGILVSGIIKLSHIGSGQNTITQAIFKDLGEDAAVEWLDNVYRVSSGYLDTRGFTVGVRDFIPEDPEGVKRKVELEYQKSLMSIEKLAEPRTIEEAERQEREISVHLNGARNVSEGLIKEAIFGEDKTAQKISGVTNNLKILYEEGYPKVTGSTIAAISGMRGQAFTLTQERPKAKLTGGTRCLPMFDPDDKDPSAHGFCKVGLAEGISVADVWQDAATSRDSIVVKYTHSATTGATSAQMHKGLEDLMVWSNGSVIASGGWIIQPIYGYDGFDPSHIEQVVTSIGKFPFFTNVKRIVGSVNNKHGYFMDTKTSKWVKLDS